MVEVEYGVATTKMLAELLEKDKVGAGANDAGIDVLVIDKEDVVPERELATVETAVSLG